MKASVAPQYGISTPLLVFVPRTTVLVVASDFAPKNDSWSKLVVPETLNPVKYGGQQKTQNQQKIQH